MIRNGLLLLLVITSLNALSQNKKKWNLVWKDDFNYTGLPDSTKWDYEIGGDGWGNHELEYYTAKRKENARVENGQLIIEAKKEDYEGMKYTSARLITKGKGDWQYGKIEVRAKLPKGLGTWPAIWMLPSKYPMKWPDDGELDIMEHVGFHHGFIHGTIHCKKYNNSGSPKETGIKEVPDCSEKFHVYGMEWSADSIKISIDNKVFFRFANEHNYEAWPFDNKMYLLLNVAVGGDWGGQKGVDENIWPQKMLVDYVRIYQ